MVEIGVTTLFGKDVDMMDVQTIDPLTASGGDEFYEEEEATYNPDDDHEHEKQPLDYYDNGEEITSDGNIHSDHEELNDLSF